MAIHIGNKNLPDGLKNSGSYVPPRQEVIHRNGQGRARASTKYKASWSWNSVSISDYTWLHDTLLNGDLDATYTSARLWDIEGTETDWGDTWIGELRNGPVVGARFTGVSIQIEVEA